MKHSSSRTTGAGVCSSRLFRRAASAAIALAVVLPSCGSAVSDELANGDRSLTPNLAPALSSPPTTSPSKSSGTMPLPTTSAQPVRPTPPTTSPAITLPLSIPDSPGENVPSPPFDPNKAISVRRSKPDSPIGIVCVAIEDISNATFNFGFAPTGYIDRKDLQPRVAFLTAQLNLTLAEIKKVRRQGTLDNSATEFAVALESGLTLTLDGIMETRVNSEDLATSTIDQLAAVVATNLKFEKLAGVDAFLAAAMKDPNCGL